MLTLAYTLVSADILS